MPFSQNFNLIVWARETDRWTDRQIVKMTKRHALTSTSKNTSKTRQIRKKRSLLIFLFYFIPLYMYLNMVHSNVYDSPAVMFLVSLEVIC